MARLGQAVGGQPGRARAPATERLWRWSRS